MFHDASLRAGTVARRRLPKVISMCRIFHIPAAASSSAHHVDLCHNTFDPENTGYISTEKFRNLLQSHGSELDPHKLEVLLALADNNSDGKICYQDFVNLVSGSE
ncbi:UNVERIFIED_CONTAM: Rhomboid- protein 3 [Gekko kuhli]